MYNETRFTILKNSDPKTAEELMRLAQEDVDSRWKMYERLAAAPVQDGKLVQPAIQSKEGK
jgi:pyruvate-ferredoxin/flavodoxin oxidoreductase